MKTADDIRELLETAANNAGSNRRLAEQIGVSAQYIGDVLLGKREPGKSISMFFGYEPVTRYRKVER